LATQFSLKTATFFHQGGSQYGRTRKVKTIAGKRSGVFAMGGFFGGQPLSELRFVGFKDFFCL
jgi:hypothetical protein